MAMASPKKHCNYLDRISSLPDEVLGHMLSFLTTADAVSKSILSSRWRYLFTLTSCLSFDDTPCLDLLKERKAKIRFRMFVYKVLELHQISPIKLFSLNCNVPHDKFDLTAWVSKAVQKGVQELCYRGCVPEKFLPDGLFMCETLVRLEISFYMMDYEMEIPLSAWLPSLKILHMEFVKFDYDSLQRLFASCELLEELTLKGCIGDTYGLSGYVAISSVLLKILVIESCLFEKGLFEIDAPNLAYLVYKSNWGVKIVPSWKYSCSLVKAELLFHYSAEDGYGYSSIQNDRVLLKAAACKTTVLKLLLNSVKLLLLPAVDEQMPDFPYLTTLSLGSCPYDAWKDVISLLDKSPRLETVAFERGIHCCGSDPVAPEDIPSFPFSCNVKEITVRAICDHEGSLILIGHLLKNAGLLKKLTVYTKKTLTMHPHLRLLVSVNIDDDDVLRIRKGLLMLPSASKDFCIEMK